jgi:transcriptional regulator with XRE-family HTH domain
MTPVKLKALGRRLYGYDWQSHVARVLGVHRCTIWRWATGNHAIPKKKAEHLQRLAGGVRRDRP